MKEVRNKFEPDVPVSLKEINKIQHRNTIIYSSLSGKLFCFYQFPQGSAVAHPWAILFIRFAERVARKL